MKTSADTSTSIQAIDTHCHLFLMEEEPAKVVATSRAGGVGALICVGIDPESSQRSLEMAQSFRGVFATAGMHPHTASGFDRRAGAVIEELLADPMVVGVGETGLDYCRRLSPQEDQQRAFRTHVALSRESGKPLVVHVRDAWDDALRILEEEMAQEVVLHCFSGDRAVAAEASARGYFMSFAGNLTYPNAQVLRDVVGSLNGEARSRVLVETDSPYLSPQQFRGSANAPARLIAVIEAVGREWEITAAQAARDTSDAARRVFPSIR